MIMSSISCLRRNPWKMIEQNGETFAGYHTEAEQ